MDWLTVWLIIEWPLYCPAKQLKRPIYNWSMIWDQISVPGQVIIVIHVIHVITQWVWTLKLHHTFLSFQAIT